LSATMPLAPPNVGDKVWVQWKDGRRLNCRVEASRQSASAKHGSNTVFTLITLDDSGEEIKTRLTHLAWGPSVLGSAPEKARERARAEEKKKAGKKDKKKEKKKGKARQREGPEGGSGAESSAGGAKKRLRVAEDPTRPLPPAPGSAPGSSAGRRALPSHRLILAPMVGGSELAFRLLCRKYGADLCYTPMMSSAQFAADPEYRRREFQTVPEDRPLVAHFSGNDPATMLAAALLVQDEVDAVDLNLGCESPPRACACYGERRRACLEIWSGKNPWGRCAALL